MTYIRTREGWLYLAAVLDLYSRKIIGWSFSDRLNSALATQALQSAISVRKPKQGLLIHSDQGAEYASNEYQRLLQKHGLICSMSHKGDCYDNAVMESFFHSMKTEGMQRRGFKTRHEARAAVFDYIEVFYNRERLHSSINYQTPVEYEEGNLVLNQVSTKLG